MSVHFLKSRSLWFSKWYEQGKEKRKYFRTESEAHSFDAERIAAESNEESGRMTLGDLAACFFRARPDFYPRTKQAIVNLLADGPGAFMRDKYADSLNRQDLERLREGLRSRNPQITNNSINHYHAYIRAILAWGVDQDLISFNPWRDYKRMKVVKPIFQPRIEDFRRLYAQLPPYLQWAMKTAYALALRPGQVELFSLLWTAFDWRRGIVIVRQGKSGKIKTVVPPQAYLAQAFERYKEDTAAGIPLVCHRDGKRVLSFRTAWLAACRRAEVKMRPYDIRHIVASEMLGAGSDLAAVAAQLGHNSVAITGATYAHVTAGSQARAAASLPGIEDEK